MASLKLASAAQRKAAHFTFVMRDGSIAIPGAVYMVWRGAIRPHAATPRDRSTRRGLIRERGHATT